MSRSRLECKEFPVSRRRGWATTPSHAAAFEEDRAVFVAPAARLPGSLEEAADLGVDKMPSES